MVLRSLLDICSIMGLLKYLCTISTAAAANGSEEPIFDDVLLLLLLSHIIVDIVNRIIIQRSIGLIQPHDTEGNEEVHRDQQDECANHEDVVGYYEFWWRCHTSLGEIDLSHWLDVSIVRTLLGGRLDCNDSHL